MPGPLRITAPGAITAARVRPAPGARPAAGRPDLEALAEQLRREHEQTLQAERDALRAARQALEQAAGELDAARERLTAEAAPALAALALEIARRVCQQQIDADAVAIDPIVTEALGRLPRCRGATVRLHPDDLARCRQAAEQPPEGVTFVPDPSVPRAGCVVESPEGTVHAGPAAGLRAAARALAEED